MAMSDDTKRRIDLAEWHAREAILLASTGHDDDSEAHVRDACEFLTIVAGKPVRLMTPDEVIAKCYTLQEACANVS